jgi:predicted transcriptional regulator
MQNLTTLSKKEQQIINAINDGGSATFATIVAKVEQKMLKKGNPLRNSLIEKLVDYKFTLNAIYSNAVNSQRKREEKDTNFVAKQNWHSKVYDTKNGAIVCNVKNTDKRYLSGIVNDAQIISYFVDGIEATKEQIDIIKEFRQKQSKPTNQNLENDIIFRVIEIDNIKKVVANKQELIY